MNPTGILVLAILNLAVLFCDAGSGLSQDSIKSEALPADFLLRDLDEVEYHPFKDSKTKAVVLIFTLTDCPIANGYAPEITRIASKYGPQGVRFFLIHADPDLKPKDARRHTKEFGFSFPVVLDPRHRVVGLAGATRVPESTVYLPDGNCVYRGRIDDLYVAPGKRRDQPTSHDLRVALDALLAGRPVPRVRTDVVGCFIPPLSDVRKP